MIRARDILGQNARNRLYIHPYNSKQAISFANSKLRTKQFLEVRDIPVPKLYTMIRNKQELRNFPWHSLPHSFVVKPNAGFGGEGIEIITGKEDKEHFRTISGGSLDILTLQNHVRDILDGRYSLGNIADKVLFEQLIVNHGQLDTISFGGLCDIRILVFNLVPVMAMMRIPTDTSLGKANVHLGGIGAGIDIGKGTVTHLTQYNRVIREVPGVGNIRGMKIPFWEQMLLISSRIQQLTGIGYLAVDLAIDRNTGPVLLEINGRAGLMLQVANLAPLRRRLERVQGIKVKTAAKGVRIAQDLFGGGIEKSISYVSGKEVIGLREELTIYAKGGAVKVKAKVDVDVPHSLVDQKLYEKILHGLPQQAQKLDHLKLKVQLAHRKFKTVVYPAVMEEAGVEWIIGKRDLKNFLIDPYKYKKKALPSLSIIPGEAVSAVLPKPLAREDQELDHLAAYIRVLKYLKPVNFMEEREKFMKKEGNYNPRFYYRALDFDPKDITTQLEQLQLDDSPLGYLLHHKRKRLLDEVELLTTVGKDHKRFTELVGRLYGEPEQYYATLAEERMAMEPAALRRETALTRDEVLDRTRVMLDSYGLQHWEVGVYKVMGARIAVTPGNTVKVRRGAVFYPRGLEAALRHEIQTHVLRRMNGEQQDYAIFAKGTSNYLETEEGLAIYVQEQCLDYMDEKFYRAARNYVRMTAVASMSFADAVAYMLEKGWSPSLAQAFQAVFRLKRGLKDTRVPGIFSKDLLYFRGYCKVKQYIEEGGTLADLYLGKIAIEDVPLAKQLCHVPEPFLLPKELH